MSSTPAIVRRIFAHLPPGRRARFLLLLVGMAVLAASEMVTLAAIALFVSALGGAPAGGVFGDVVGRLVGAWMDGPRATYVLALSVSVVVLLLVRNTLAFAVRYFGARYSASVQAHIGSLLMERFVGAPYEWHLGRNTARLIQAVEWRHHVGVVVQRLLEGVTDLLVLVSILAALIIHQPLVGLTASAALAAMATLVYRRIRRVLRRTSVDVRTLTRTGFGEISTALQGIKEVRVNSAEELFLGRVRQVFARLVPKLASQRVLESASGWVLETVGFGAITAAIAILVFVAHQPVALVFATISTLAIAAWRALPTLNRVVTAGTQIRFALPFVESVVDYLRDTPVESPPDPRRETSPLRLERAVDLDGVTYTYPEATRPALSGITVRLERGSVVGLVGVSGAGKSTCADLIAGLLVPSPGAVRVDGQALGAAERSRWIRSVGYVTQSPFLLDASLAENVALGQSPGVIDVKWLQECCELAAVDFLADLPQGIWTPLGERGTRLSGGQRQRVAIARALYRRPALIIFDEATSALDDRSERAIRRAIRALHGRYTVLVIAHRLSSIEDCDLVVWLDGGVLREVGPASEVLARYTAHGAQR